MLYLDFDTLERVVCDIHMPHTAPNYFGNMLEEAHVCLLSSRHTMKLRLCPPPNLCLNLADYVQISLLVGDK